MRRTGAVLGTGLLVAVSAAAASAAMPLPPDAGTVPGEAILVRYDPAVGADQRRAVRADAGVTRETGLPLAGLELVEPVAGTPTSAAIAELEASSAVAYAEPDVARSAAVIPDDPLFAQQWALDNTGQAVDGEPGTPDADVDAPKAWDVTTGSASVTVAVVDSGLDLTHPDLAGNVWSNPGETSNGLDDDGNGLVDDVHGWDWVGADADPTDLNGHGTHVAGTIAARGGDGAGVAGLAWEASVVPMRVLNALGLGTVSSLISAYAYAGMSGADVVNASLAGRSFSQAEHDAIAAAPDTLFVVAAGNAGEDVDATPAYPCAYDLPNIVCVGATDADDAPAAFSSFGATTVDLAAPGVSILSTWPGAGWDTLSGTSMATPHVTGTAALAWALRPQATVAEVRDALLAGVDVVPALAGRTATGGRLNAAGTLAALPALPDEPEAPGGPGGPGEPGGPVEIGP